MFGGETRPRRSSISGGAAASGLTRSTSGSSSRPGLQRSPSGDLLALARPTIYVNPTSAHGEVPLSPRLASSRMSSLASRPTQPPGRARAATNIPSSQPRDMPYYASSPRASDARSDPLTAASQGPLARGETTLEYARRTGNQELFRQARAGAWREEGFEELDEEREKESESDSDKSFPIRVTDTRRASVSHLPRYNNHRISSLATYTGLEYPGELSDDRGRAREPYSYSGQREPSPSRGQRAPSPGRMPFVYEAYRPRTTLEDSLAAGSRSSVGSPGARSSPRGGDAANGGGARGPIVVKGFDLPGGAPRGSTAARAPSPARGLFNSGRTAGSGSHSGRPLVPSSPTAGNGSSHVGSMGYSSAGSSGGGLGRARTPSPGPRGRPTNGRGRPLSFGMTYAPIASPHIAIQQSPLNAMMEKELDAARTSYEGSLKQFQARMGRQ